MTLRDMIGIGPVPYTSRRARTRYAKSGDVNIAYQVVGDGPVDLVMSGFMSPTSS